MCSLLMQNYCKWTLLMFMNSLFFHIYYIQCDNFSQPAACIYNFQNVLVYTVCISNGYHFFLNCKFHVHKVKRHTQMSWAKKSMMIEKIPVVQQHGNSFVSSYVKNGKRKMATIYKHSNLYIFLMHLETMTFIYILYLYVSWVLYALVCDNTIAWKLFLCICIYLINAFVDIGLIKLSTDTAAL